MRISGKLFLLISLWLGVLAIPAMADSEDEEIYLGDKATAEKAAGRGCVEPTELMRSNHMEFLLHHRDEVVLHGIRTKKYNLKACIDCHVAKDKSGEYIPINSGEQFCNHCHEEAAAHLDCFECHATKPRKR